MAPISECQFVFKYMTQSELEKWFHSLAPWQVSRLRNIKFCSWSPCINGHHQDFHFVNGDDMETHMQGGYHWEYSDIECDYMDLEPGRYVALSW